MKIFTRSSLACEFVERIVTLLICLGLGGAAYATSPPSPGNNPPNPDLDSWSFNNGWYSDYGFAPVSSSTSLTTSQLGDGTCLVLDSTNAAWLQYHITESDGTNELTVNQGTVMLWFAPNWTDANNGGTGPGQPSRLIEVGTYTTNASIGWWSLWLDVTGTNVYFSAQTNGSSATYLSAPVAWAMTNRWHMLTITYSATNSAFYWDNTLITNGLPVTVWPAPSVQSNGFFLGSDSTGIAQVHGMIDDVQTFSYPLSSTNVAAIFSSQSFFYYANVLNRANFAAAPSYATNTPNFSAVTGPGFLTDFGQTNSCVLSTNGVWLTNIFAMTTNNGTVDVTFTMEGTWNGVTGPFDVFANGVLSTNSPAFQWVWMGQGYSCHTYMLTNLPLFSAYLILGTPLDSDSDGLTDAYELLVSHSNPHVADSSGDGMLDGWKVMWGLNPSVNNPAQISKRANFTYTLAGWLDAISGLRSETIGLDSEQNVLSDH